MKKEVIVGIDIGTSSLKYTVVASKNGIVLKNMRVDYDDSEIAPGVVPVSLYEKVLVQTLVAINSNYNILCLGFSVQMYSMCQQTNNGLVAYQWNSLWQRNKNIEGELKRYMGKSGCPVDTLYPAYKLFSASKEGKRFIPYGLKEHLIKFITGNLATDYSSASASGLLDIYDRNWNEALLEDMGYSVKEMPEIKKYNTIIGYLSILGTDVANTKIPVVPGLGDGMSASYACKNTSKICVNAGTSMAARAFIDFEDLKHSDETWTYVIDEKTYIVGGISSNGCSVINWSEDLNLYDDKICITSEGDVMFFPWLHGERTPYWSSDLKGTFTGIDINTDKKSLNAAIVKGVGFTITNLVNLVSQNVSSSQMIGVAGGGVHKKASSEMIIVAGGGVHKKASSEMIIVAGGGVHKKALMEVLSGSISMKTGLIHDSDYLASYGAALAAAEALELEVDKCVEVKEVIHPTHRYEKEYEKWLQMASRLVNLYD